VQNIYVQYVYISGISPDFYTHPSSSIWAKVLLGGNVNSTKKERGRCKENGKEKGKTFTKGDNN
jgi:hypothetical protein